MTKELLLINGNIYNPYSDEHVSGSILIKDGMLTEIGDVKPSGNEEVIDCSGKVITTGFIDIHVHFREPGREDKETLKTGADAALAGGFTRVCVMPNTNPPLDNPESIRFIQEKSKDLPVKIYPIGAMTIGQKGVEIAEYGGMVNEGAVAISDDGLPVQNGQVMRYALEYSQKYNIPVINHAEDIHVRNDGIMNESALSTRMGLTGNPACSESIMVYRDLELAMLTGGRIHIPHVSTKKSVDLIREYKAKGVNVTAEVTPHHIGLNENAISQFNTNAKVAPPLRDISDCNALIEGLTDGTINCIATDHAPHTIEDKEMDIQHSPCGMIGLESAFGLSYTVLSKHNISIESIIQILTKNPADVMGWDLTGFEIGKSAEINIIDPDLEWVFSEEHICSRSKNSPMVGLKFKGKVETTIANKTIYKQK